MKKKMILSYVLSFLAAIILFLIIMLGSLHSYTSSPKAILKELDKQNYYEKLAQDIEKEMKLDIISSGLPTSVLEKIFSKEMIQEEIEASLTNTYRHQEYEIHTSVVEENLKKNIEDYLAKNNIVVTDEEALKEYVNETTATYKSGINLYGYSKYIKTIIKKLQAPITWAMIILIFIEVGIVFCIYKFCEEKHISALCVTTAIMLFLTKFYFMEHVDINHLFLFSQFFSDTLIAIINSILNLITWIGILLLIYAVGYIVIKNYKESKNVEI